MSQRRTLILVAAIAIGALASFLVWNYVNGIQDEAYSGAERVPVFLVKQEIPRGTTGTEAQAYIARETIPRKFMPSNAIAALEDISGKIAISKLVPNQVVVGDMFVDASDPRAQQSFSERLKKIRDEDQVTVTIQVDKTRGAANLIQPGDYVNILLTASSEGSTADSSSGGGKSGQTNAVFANGSRYLYQKILVLAIDSSAVPQPGEAATSSAAGTTPTYTGAITFIVPAKAAQVITSVDPGAIYLSLVSPDYKPVPQAPISPSDPLPAEDQGQLTPYGPKGADSAN